MPTASPPKSPAEAISDGRFVRQQYIIQDRVTADGSSGFPAEAGRYHLYVSLACPWAHRSIIVLRLLGLEDVVGLSEVDPIRDERGWAFNDQYPDRVNRFHFLSEAYLATDPNYSLRYTVPCLWDTKTGRLVSNHYPHLTIDFETQFTAFHKKGAPDLYPEPLRAGIDAVNADIYRDVNNGVYRCGFSTTQEAYEEAFDALFARLDALEEHFTAHRYLVGEQLTEADICLWVTLVRFDAVYHNHFKCNRRKLAEYPNLWAYARDLYQRPGFGDTTNFSTTKRHYYMTHPTLNPTRIVPKGPEQNWNEPHGRERLGSTP